ncbi:hypothetical protein [Yoonia sp. MH D7]
MTMTEQVEGFQARVRKISDPRNISYYDPDLAMHIPKRLSKQVIAKVKGRRINAASLLASLVLGALAYVLSQLLAARFGMIYVDAPLVSLSCAMLLAVMIGGLLNLKIMLHWGVQFFGIWLMSLSLHNLVWLFPDTFKIAYSPEFVAAIQAGTTAASLTFLGTTYTL